MRASTGEVRFSRSPHLVELIAEVERLATTVREHAPSTQDPETLRTLHEDAAVASMRLDGSRITAPPADVPAAADAPTASERPTGRRGTWLDAMARGLEEVDDEQIHALEYQGVRAAHSADGLAEALLVDARRTLAELHTRLTAGLLDSDRAGRPRESEQAVHDASIGRIIYFPAEPLDIPSRLNLLAGWLETAGAREHAVISSGVLHFELLHIHPYEAANGRLARAAARLVLRARGLDPDGAGVPELALAEDPIGYYEEIARTVRRRDLTIWLERWGEAVAAGLREALDRFGLTSTSVSDRAAGFLDAWGGGPFTVADYRATARVGPEDMRADLRELLDAGRVRRVPGARGLRYEVV